MFEIWFREESQRCIDFFLHREIWEVLGIVVSLEFCLKAHKARAFI